ncbi:hypothetical protein PB1_06182 [Bacillus methanolicus PB1]|uniref:Uncharacterized protein n=1 Tax=Bacillus methanolicus PB1 TaxID=997296 RepID=I3E0A9_BACMT|nr:hypothetical protein PB1_06182 [Bacillus methanolicus PB1]
MLAGAKSACAFLLKIFKTRLSLVFGNTKRLHDFVEKRPSAFDDFRFNFPGKVYEFHAIFRSLIKRLINKMYVIY